MKNLTAYSGIIGAVLFISAAILGGFQFSSYSHLSHYISESYAIGSPYGLYLRFLGYFPSGVALTVFAFTAMGHFEKSNATRWGFCGLGIFYGLATVVVSIFPCDAGCNKEWIDPSVSQIIHHTVGLLTYILFPSA